MLTCAGITALATATEPCRDCRTRQGQGEKRQLFSSANGKRWPNWDLLPELRNCLSPFAPWFVLSYSSRCRRRGARRIDGNLLSGGGGGGGGELSPLSPGRMRGKTTSIRRPRISDKKKKRAHLHHTQTCHAILFSLHGNFLRRHRGNF